MRKQCLLIFTLFCGISLYTGNLLADEENLDQDQDQEQEQEQEQEQSLHQEDDQRSQRIYGSQLMTKEEREAHRAEMRAAKNAEERERLRKEHHEKMKERARHQNIILPDVLPPRERFMGPGGMGSGGVGRDR